MIELKNVSDLKRVTKMAQDRLDTTIEEVNGWKLQRLTQHFTLELIQMYTEKLTTLEVIESGNEAERVRGEIRVLNQIIEQLTETNND